MNGRSPGPFANWLRRLSRRNRRIAQFLALGNRTSDTARKFKVSEGRVSQLRRELAESWRAFVGMSRRGRCLGCDLIVSLAFGPPCYHGTGRPDSCA